MLAQKREIIQNRYYRPRCLGIGSRWYNWCRLSVLHRNDKISCLSLRKVYTRLYFLPLYIFLEYFE